MAYTAVDPSRSPEQSYDTEGPIQFSNSIPGYSAKDRMFESVYEAQRPSDDSDPVQGKPPNYRQKTWTSLFSRTNSGFSQKSWKTKAWEHKLNEKRIRSVPTDTDSVRYFDRSRQTRRVFWSCFAMWLITATICGGLAGTIGGFSSLEIISQQQKYAYNALVTGLSILLGLAFAAQFKQYCEMMRWRFLASSYRTIDDFEEVLGCDSWRSTLKLIFRRKKGQWYPTKAQLLAFFWLVIFIAFNVFAALIGLTYSIDVSETYVSIAPGNVSVLDMSYIATLPQANPIEYGGDWQMMAANLYGQSGQNFDTDDTLTIDDVVQYDIPTVFTTPDWSEFWYRFVDLSASSSKVNVVTDRTVNATATCEELKITYGGYAGLAYVPEDLDMHGLGYVDSDGSDQYIVVDESARGLTTWMGNTSSTCGPRCVQLLALVSANNLTVDDVEGSDTNAVPEPHLWSCTNTISQITNLDTDGFANATRLELPDIQAWVLAGAIGWSGVTGFDTSTNTTDPLQYQIIHGNNGFNLNGNATKEDVAIALMQFSTMAIAAMDYRGGPRINMTGSFSPSPATTVNVKWNFAGAILAGIPTVQFIMLLAVVYFSGKAIILEPSYLTAAHLLYPVMHKLGPGGVLMSVDEIAEKLGPDFKVAYSVRPDANDPGPQVTEFVRDLDLVDEREGHGYLRGKMPEGRYD